MASVRMACRRRASAPNAPRETPRAVSTIRAGLSSDAGPRAAGRATRRISAMRVASGVSFGTKPCGHIESKLTGHAVVEHDDIRVEIADEAQGLSTVRRDAHRDEVVARCNGAAKPFAHHRIVVGD